MKTRVRIDAAKARGRPREACDWWCLNFGLHKGFARVTVFPSPLLNRCAAPSSVYLQRRRVTAIKLGALQASRAALDDACTCIANIAAERFPRN